MKFERFENIEAWQLARRDVDMQLFSLFMIAWLSITASWHARSEPGFRFRNKSRVHHVFAIRKATNREP